MDKDKINDIVKNVHDKSNKDLFEARAELIKEFENTKELIINLTRHMDSIEDAYIIINDEIGKRTK